VFKRLDPVGEPGVKPSNVRFDRLTIQCRGSGFLDPAALFVRVDNDAPEENAFLLFSGIGLICDPLKLQQLWVGVNPTLA
jgi:hypothetical protein